jgi:hypothetical protein
VCQINIIEIKHIHHNLYYAREIKYDARLFVNSPNREKHQTIGDNSTSVDPCRAHAKTPDIHSLTPTLKPVDTKQGTHLAYQPPTMSTSPTPAADLPAAPVLDALPDTASPDYPIALVRRLACLSIYKVPFKWQEDIKLILP